MDRNERYFAKWANCLRAVLVCFAILCFHTETLFGQAPEIWEYSPYRVRFWVSASPSLGLSQESLADLHRKIADNIDIQFGPTWRTQADSTPESLFGSVLYHVDKLTVEQLLSRELVLMIGKTDAAKEAFLALNPPPPETEEEKAKHKKDAHASQKSSLEGMADVEGRAASLNSVRTLDSALNRLKSISLMPLQYSALQRDVASYLQDERWSTLQKLATPFSGTNEELYKSLESGKVIAALVQKTDVDKFRKVARQIPARFPWQPEALLRENDKIYMVSLDRDGESLKIQLRELDAFFRRLGELEVATVPNLNDVPRQIAYLTRMTFSPIARIEDADFKTAVLRVRASGLVTTENHATQIVPGDVLQPLIRRDDLNGNPTVLQAIPFTYIAVTEQIDVARSYGAIFTASRGALSSAKNRRTQRVGLKVNARHMHTDLKLSIQRTPGSSVPGAEIYLRTPGHDDLKMVGRTDWRGVLPLAESELPEIEYDLPSSSKTKTISGARTLTASVDSSVPMQTAAVHQSASNPSSQKLVSYQQPGVDEVLQGTDSAKKNVRNEGEGEQPSSTSTEAPTAAMETPPPAEEIPKGTIRLNVPLYLYYVKDGETLLARLPIVTGYRTMETADLPDDRRRLEAEAFLKGVQGEVLDLVVRRKILATRIRSKLKDPKLDRTKKQEETTRLMDELKRTKSYDRLAEQLELIQRRVFSADREPGPPTTPVVKRINKMVETTRQMMQKYLQDTLVRELEVELGVLQ